MKQLLRSSLLWPLQLLQRRRFPDIDRKSRISHSRVPGLISAGAQSFVSESTIAGHVAIGDHTAILHAQVSGNISIGRYTTVNGPHTKLVAGGESISIGNFCSIAPGCFIYAVNHDLTRCTTYNIFRNLIDAADRQDFIWAGDLSKDICTKGGIEIGHDVWIGAQSVILSGVRIGTGAVIAANSTVTRDVPPYVVVAGSPAVARKPRFNDELTRELMRSEWWLWDDARIRRNADLFAGPLTVGKLRGVHP